MKVPKLTVIMIDISLFRDFNNSGEHWLITGQSICRYYQSVINLF